MPKRAPRGTILLAALLLAAPGCANDPTGDDGGNGGGGTAGSGGTGGGGTGGGGSGGGSGGSGGSGGGVTPEYGECVIEVPGLCVPGLSCISFGMVDRCIHACTPPDGSCPSGTQICVPQYEDPDAGYCAERRAFYETCNPVGALGACERDAFCHAGVTTAPERCVPVCDVGSLGDLEAVAACPDLPADFGAGATDCLPITIAGDSGSLCGLEVAVGEPCDQGVWRCNLDDARPDTDDGAEPAAIGDVDPGALTCAPVGADSRCLRICSADGVSISSCDCPAGDPACSDPSEGLIWSCQHWAELSAGVHGCVLIEDCSADATVCDDNLTNGWTNCAATPYDDGPSSICGPEPG